MARVRGEEGYLLEDMHDGGLFGRDAALPVGPLLRDQGLLIALAVPGGWGLLWAEPVSTGVITVAIEFAALQQRGLCQRRGGHTSPKSDARGKRSLLKSNYTHSPFQPGSAYCTTLKNASWDGWRRESNSFA